MRSVGEKLMAQGEAKGLAKGLTKGEAKGLAKGLIKGRVKERAEGVLKILAARGVAVDTRSRRRILSCTDGATLERWFDRALRATRLSDVLGEVAH
jgi:hypothetical protein